MRLCLCILALTALNVTMFAQLASVFLDATDDQKMLIAYGLFGNGALFVVALLGMLMCWCSSFHYRLP